MVNRSQHNSWKKQQSKSHSNPSQNSWKQRKSAAPVEPVPKHRSIRCMAEGPTPCRSIFSGWRQKSSEAPVEPMVMKSKHRCIGCTLFQNTCLSWSVNLFSTGWTDAPTEHAPVQWRKPGYCVRTPTATIWTQTDRLNRRLKTDTHRFFRCSRFFCSGLPTAM